MKSIIRHDYSLPKILGGCFSWDMVRNVVHVNNKQLDNSLLDRPCSSLAKLPQWAICFNTVENNIVLDGTTIVGVIFYRNFTHMPTIRKLREPKSHETIMFRW